MLCDTLPPRPSANDLAGDHVEFVCAHDVLGPVTADARGTGVRNILESEEQLYMWRFILGIGVSEDDHLGNMLVA